MSAAASPSPRSAVAAGIAALSHWRLLLLLTFASVVLGGLAAAPLGPAIKESFTGTLAGDHIARNDQVLAPADVFDFLKTKAPAVAGFERATLWAGLLGILLQVFFAGGIVETLGRRGPRLQSLVAGDFWFGARRHFAHNLKCFAIFGVALGVPLALWLAVAGTVLHKAFEHAVPNAPARTAARIVVAAVALLIFGILTLLYDFARAARRSDPQIGAWRAYRQALTRLRGRWLRGLGLLILWTIVALAGIGALAALAWSQPTPSGAAVAANLLLLLLFLAVRPVARVGAWGSVLALYDASVPPPVPVRRVTVEPPSPVLVDPVWQAPAAVVPTEIPEKTAWMAESAAAARIAQTEPQQAAESIAAPEATEPPFDPSETPAVRRPEPSAASTSGVSPRAPEPEPLAEPFPPDETNPEREP